MRILRCPLLLAIAAGCNPPGGEVKLQELMAKVRGPSERTLVRQMLASDDPDVRRSAIEQLSTRPHCLEGKFLDAYAALSKDPSPLVRAAACRALGRAGDPRYAEHVVRRLEDPNAKVRWDAAAALDAMPTPKAVQPLSRAALNDPYPDVRSTAVRALRHYRRADVVETLLRCLEDREFAVRFRAGEALSELTGADAGTDPARWRQTLADRPQLFADSGGPDRPWWDLMGVTSPKPTPRPAPAGPTTAPAPPADARPPTTATRPAAPAKAAKPRRPWWDWLGVTEKKEPTTRPAAPTKPAKPRRPWWDWLGVTEKKEPTTRPAAPTKTAKPQRPWWDWLGVTEKKEPTTRPAAPAKAAKPRRPWWDWFGVTEKKAPAKPTDEPSPTTTAPAPDVPSDAPGRPD